MLMSELFMTAHKANAETCLGLTGELLEGVEKVVALNLEMAHEMLNEAAKTTRSALASENPGAWLIWLGGLLQPERAAGYSRGLYEIAATTHAGLAKVVEYTATKAQEKFVTLMSSVGEAPAAEGAATLVRSAVAATTNAYEAFRRAGWRMPGLADSTYTPVTPIRNRLTRRSRHAA
jgi:phasin family protein